MQSLYNSDCSPWIFSNGMFSFSVLGIHGRFLTYFLYWMALDHKDSEEIMDVPIVTDIDFFSTLLNEGRSGMEKENSKGPNMHQPTKVHVDWQFCDHSLSVRPETLVREKLRAFCTQCEKNIAPVTVKTKFWPFLKYTCKTALKFRCKTCTNSFWSFWAYNFRAMGLKDLL